jgi:hypothetical protein
MRYLFLCGLLLLTGCESFGPHQAQRVDDPRLPITEQQRRARANLGTTDETYLSGPHSAGFYKDARWDPGSTKQ